MTRTAKPARKFAHVGNLISFDPPGVITMVSAVCGQFCGTQGNQINARGDIAGSYQDTNLVQHGFLRTGQGRITTFDAPGAGSGAGSNQGTAAQGINDNGIIVGYYQSSDFIYHGFIRNKNGTFVTFDAPGAGMTANASFNQGTTPYGINSRGDTTGVYFDASGQQHGFMRLASGATMTIDPAGSILTVINDPNMSINNSDVVTGTYADSNFIFHLWVHQPNGTFTFINPPGAFDTFGGDTNQAGTTRGYDIDAGAVAHGVIRSKSGAITVYDDPNASKLPNVPQAQGTAPFTINPRGDTAGVWDDAAGMNHGFERYADGTFVNFDAPGAAGTGIFQGTFPFTNNASGSVAGRWTDSNGLIHGFVWTPHP